MKGIRILAVLLSIGLLAMGCSQEAEITAPDTQTTHSFDKNGTETLGPPSIDIAAGSCFAQGGVGMVGLTEGILEINVPAGTINQVLLYWAGGTTGAPGDAMIKIDGNDVDGELIGGETEFFQSGGATYYFWGYRADITDMGLVDNGDNSFTITDFNFDWSGGHLDENNGIGMMVIYDDGTPAEITVVDGLDLAFFRFDAPLDATVPQTFTFTAEPVDRMGRLVIFAGSVGFERPNGILLTTSAGGDLRSDLLGSVDGPLWDTLCLTDVLLPAGDTTLTVEIISTPVTNPLGASMAWVGAGLSVPVTPPEEEFGCRLTGGGNDEFFFGEDEFNGYTFGGQAGAPIASQPQPWGNWTHTQKDGAAGSFTFHAGTPSAPEGTEIDWIECSDPGWCVQARQAPAKQLDFGGVGTFKNMRNVPEDISEHIVLHESLHYFEVNIDDLGEPGGHDLPDGCDPLGFGLNGGPELADCDCPDFYRIRIYEGMDASSNIMYEVYGYIDGGNFQIHPPTGRDRNLFR